MASIIDLPDFMFNYNQKSYGKFSKIFITLYALAIGFIHKHTSKNLFCFIMNLFFKKDGRIYFKDNHYSKILWNGSEFSYTNKRIDRIIIDHKKNFEVLYDTYCLDKINFQDNDKVIDCGANVGELYISFKLKNQNIDYIAFEPDTQIFQTLQRNLSKYSKNLYSYALSDKNKNDSFYLSSDGADSSLIYSGFDEKITVETKTLDSFKYSNVKLLKIEAEGAELEVLKGAANSLVNVQYISVDYGPERGLDNESTSVDIINFLYSHNFKIINVSKYRQVGLFKNILF